MKFFKKNGFTLIELLIVVIVIGILVTIALPQYFKVVERGRRAEALSVLSDIRKGEIGYRLESPTGSYTSNLAALYLFNETPTSPRFTFSFSTATNQAVATPTAGVVTYYMTIGGVVTTSGE